MNLLARHLLGALLGIVSLAACTSSPSVAPPASSAGTSAPRAVGAASPASCRSKSECAAGQACVFDRPGCASPAGRCAALAPVECRASQPVATCDGASYAACPGAPLEVPFFGRADGKPHFPYTPGASPADLSGTVTEVQVLHVPDEILTDVAMSAAQLERHASAERRSSAAPEDIRAALGAFTALAGAGAAQGGDLRWELVLLGAGGRRLTAVGFDAFGRTGEIDGRGVTFDHAGGLAAAKALAAHMKPAPSKVTTARGATVESLTIFHLADTVLTAVAVTPAALQGFANVEKVTKRAPSELARAVSIVEHARRSPRKEPRFDARWGLVFEGGGARVMTVFLDRSGTRGAIDGEPFDLEDTSIVDWLRAAAAP